MPNLTLRAYNGLEVYASENKAAASAVVLRNILGEPDDVAAAIIYSCGM